MVRKPLLKKNLERYDGRIIGAAPGTHAGIVAMIARHVHKRGAVLDLGTHSGALLLRLKTVGFTQLTGADLDPTRFDVPGADFRRIELNEPFASNFDRKFQLIIATEVIEHLDSPRVFLQEVRYLLDDDGWLALSLPNVASWQGRIKFLLKGELWGFGERNYRAQRHISPITFEQMTMMMRELGFEVVEKAAVGSFSTLPLKVLTFPLWGPSVFLGGASTLGESAIFLARKANPEASLKTPTHYQKRWRGIPDRIGLEFD
jgi:SAM-dependent methyltransferase